MKPAQITHITIAKGIGILLVAFGHNPLVGLPSSWLFTFVYAFHMPLFFFLSGIFFRPEVDFWRLFKQKSAALLKPYITTLVLLSLFFIFIKKIPAEPYFTGMVYGIGSSIAWVPLWFLPHLWLVFLCVWGIHRALATTIKKIPVLWLLLLLWLTFGYFLARYFQQPILSITGFLPNFELNRPHIGLPFTLDMLPLTSFYFILGFALRNYVIMLPIKPPLLPWLTLSSFGSLGLLTYLVPATLDFDMRKYDSLWLSTSYALLGIFATLSLAKLCEKQLQIRRILTYLGSASLIIFIFHGYIQDKVIRTLNHPYGNTFAAIVAYFSSIVISLLLWEIIRRQRCLALLWLPRTNHKQTT
jgi:fucose 4-O-acetylase-like acetyltransferase